MKFDLSSFRPSGTAVVAGAASGVTSVLLLMLNGQHPPLTLALGFISPLPVMIATLAFGPLSGLVSVIVGAIFVVVFDLRMGHLVLVDDPSSAAALYDGVIVLVGLGIPALLLVLMVSLPIRPPLAGAAPPRMRPDELRLSRTLMTAVICAVVSVGAVYAIEIVKFGSLAALQEKSQSAVETAMKTAIAAHPPAGQAPPTDRDIHVYATALIAVQPWLTAAFLVICYLANLYLAARIAVASGGIAAKNWPDIPRNLRLPRAAALALAIALGLSITSGIVGLASGLVAATLVTAFGLQGLAVVHALTRGHTWRLTALIGAYLLPFILWSVLGLLDTAFSFRDRQVSVERKQPERKSPWK